MFGRCGFTSPVEGVTLRGLLGRLPQFIPPLVSPSSPPLHIINSWYDYYSSAAGEEEIDTGQVRECLFQVCGRRLERRTCAVLALFVLLAGALDGDSPVTETRV